MSKDEALERMAENARELGLDYESAPVQEIDWKDQYEKQKRRAEMWIAKYEKDIGPLEYAAPAAQRQWVGLTDEERDDLLDNYITAEGRARAIEAKLKEKNT